MEKKKIPLIIVIALSIVVLFALPASALTDWYVCTVDEAGSGGSEYVNFRLTDSNGSFTRVWFRAKQGAENRMLAVALTAFSNNFKVKVYTDPDLPTVPQRIISYMYINP